MEIETQFAYLTMATPWSIKLDKMLANRNMIGEIIRCQFIDGAQTAWYILNGAVQHIITQVLDKETCQAVDIADTVVLDALRIGVIVNVEPQVVG